MQFSPDLNKQANDVIFSRKSSNFSHPPVTLNNSDIKKYPNQKHYGIVLDSKLDFKFHVDQKIKNCNQSIGLIRRLSVSVLRKETSF